jgi:Tfp pilus assembly protein PilW
MRNHDSGFTLGEVVVSMFLTLVVMGAAFTGFNSSMRLAETSRIVSETNQGLQVTMSLMVRDLIQAGQGIPLGGIPLPSGAGATPVVRPGPPGAVLTFNPAWTALPAVTTGSALGPAVVGVGVATDIVTVLYADRTLFLSQFPLTAIAADGSTMTVNAGTNIGGADGIKAGDLILFSNANGNALQTVTGGNGGQTVFFANGDAFDLNARTAAQGTILNLGAAGVFPPTTATRITMVSYYLDATTDPTVPRLVKQINMGPRLAIGLGAENLQLTYDLVDGVTNPANVPEPPVGTSHNQIRKANLFISARSLEASPHTRAFVRNSLATDVGFRSLSFVDRFR